MFFPFKILKKKKFLIFLIPLFLTLFFLPFTFSPPSFQELTDQLFFQDIATDTLSLHYTLAYPSHFCVDSYSVTLPEYQKDLIKQSHSKIENFLHTLKTMDLSRLSPEEYFCHHLLTNYFTLQKKGFSYTYFEEYFSPSSGIPSNYPILMAEYTFRTKQDVTDYLTLLADTPNYFNSYFTFQQERAKKGYYLASVSLKKTINQCDTIITSQSLTNNSHFLQITFNERLSSLVAQKIISKEEAFQFMSKNNYILSHLIHF